MVSIGQVIELGNRIVAIGGEFGDLIMRLFDHRIPLRNGGGPLSQRGFELIALGQQLITLCGKGGESILGFLEGGFGEFEPMAEIVEISRLAFDGFGLGINLGLLLNASLFQMVDL